MSRLNRRVQRLESNEGGETGIMDVCAVVPESWPREHQESAANKLAQEQGVKPPCVLFPAPECRKPELFFMDWAAVVEHLTQTNDERRRKRLAETGGKE